MRVITLNEGVLRNNQMELDQYGGSALFPAAAIVEHNCNPNCSFSTASEDDSTHSVVMTALTHINAGKHFILLSWSFYET